MAAPSSPWLPPRRPQPAGALRLFCFPFAGGGASTYREWQAALGPGVEVCPVQLPGREERMNERAETSLRVLVSRLADGLEPWLRGRFAFFGHSMGALVQYELTRELERRGAPLPLLMMPSARRAPHLALEGEPIHDLPEKDFIDALVRRYQAIPQTVLAEPELMALFVPLLKADFRLLETYRPDLAAPLLDVPIHAFAGAADTGESVALAFRWRELSRGPFRLDAIDGGHFFVSEARGALLQAVSGAIVAALNPGRVAEPSSRPVSQPMGLRAQR